MASSRCRVWRGDNQSTLNDSPISCSFASSHSLQTHSVGIYCVDATFSRSDRIWNYVRESTSSPNSRKKTQSTIEKNWRWQSVQILLLWYIINDRSWSFEVRPLVSFLLDMSVARRSLCIWSWAGSCQLNVSIILVINCNIYQHELQPYIKPEGPESTGISILEQCFRRA